jgi:hypothetical protein
MESVKKYHNVVQIAISILMAASAKKDMSNLKMVALL